MFQKHLNFKNICIDYSIFNQVIINLLQKMFNSLIVMTIV